MIMGITLNQLEDRREARNPAQWDWRVLDTECHQAGNCPILNLKFKQSIKPPRSNRGVRRMFTLARVRQRRIGLNKWSRSIHNTRRMFTSAQTRHRSVHSIRGMQ